MFCIIDIETEGLVNPQKIWVIVCKEFPSGTVKTFKNVHENPKEFLEYAQSVSVFIGHNVIGFDYPVLVRLLGLEPDKPLIDTLVVSRLLNFEIEGGHSLEAWGTRFKSPKGNFKDFSQYSPEMEKYCIQDAEITFKLYKHFEQYIFSDQWKDALRLEHDMAKISQGMSETGFAFDIATARKLYEEIEAKVLSLDTELVESFPPRSVLLRTITPKATKHGTISRVDFRWLDVPDLSPYSVNASFSLFDWVPFNPGSPKQIVERLNEAGWKPFEKTKGHIQCERDLRHCRDKAQREILEERLKEYQRTGWKVSEDNLSTLPDYTHLEEWLNNCRIKIPQHLKNTIEPTTSITQTQKEKLLENITTVIKTTTKKNNLNESTELLYKTLIECLPNSTDVVKFVETTNHLWSIIVIDQDVYVDFSASIAIPDWHGLRNTNYLQQTISIRKAARKLAQRLLLASRRSTLNEWITAYNETTGRIHGRFLHIGAWTQRMSHAGPNMANIPSGETAYATEMRSLWTVPKGNLLVGVDADGIQLRILAHYMNDKKFTEALINGSKANGTDAHTLNQMALGKDICQSRDDAKTFIYAWLLGAGTAKIASILRCTYEEAQVACENFLEAYPGLLKLKREQIPYDAKRGYFIGLDKRLVLCNNEHLMLAGYLQNGEAIAMKKANVLWRQQLIKENVPFWQVNFVHDEWQTETVGNIEVARYIAKVQADSLRIVGEQLGLNCPLAGSTVNSHNQETIGTNWHQTH